MFTTAFHRRWLMLLPVLLIMGGCKATIYTPHILSNQDMTLADLPKKDLHVGFDQAPSVRTTTIEETWVTVDLGKTLDTQAEATLPHVFRDVQILSRSTPATAKLDDLDLIIRINDASGAFAVEGGFAWSVTQSVVFGLYTPDGALQNTFKEETKVQFFMGSMNPAENTKIAYQAAETAAKAIMLQFLQDYTSDESPTQATFQVRQDPRYKKVSELPPYAQRDNETLCRFSSIGWLVGKSEKSRAEIMKRNLIAANEWPLIENSQLEIGMTECAALGASYNFNSPFLGVDKPYVFGTDNRVILEDYNPSEVSASYTNYSTINPSRTVRKQSYVPKYLVTFRNGRLVACKAVALNRYGRTNDLDKLFPYPCHSDVPGFKKD